MTEKLKLNLKSSWNEITLKEFFEIKDILENFDENSNPVLKDADLISILSGVPVKQILQAKSHTLLNLVKSLDFLKEEINGNVSDSYDIAGVKYKCITNPADLNVAQYADATTLVKEDKASHLHEILACFMYIDGEEYNPENKAKNEKFLFENFNVADANAIMVFFSAILMAYTEAILRYSEKDLKKLIRKNKDLERQKFLINQIAKIKYLRKNGISK